MKIQYSLKGATSALVRVHIVVHWISVEIFVLEFFFVGTDATDDRVFDLHPLTSHVGGFVGIAGTGDVVGGVGHHLEGLSVTLVLVASEVVESSSTDNRFFPRKEFVCDVVDSLQLWALFFGVAKFVSVLDFVWLPFVGTDIGTSFDGFTLDGSSGPDILLSVFADEVAVLFGFLFVFLSAAFGFHSVERSENFGEIGARSVLIELNCLTGDPDS